MAALFLGAAFAATTPAQAINLLLNPSFESPVAFPSFLVFGNGDTIGTGWEVASASLAVAVVDDFFTGGGVIWPEPTHGEQFLYLGASLSASTIFQKVTLGVASYNLGFDLAHFLSGGFPEARLYVDIVPDGGGASLLAGEQLYTRDPGSDFSRDNVIFSVAAAGDYRLTLRSESGHPANVDNFTLLLDSAPPTGAVPDGGSTVAILGIACAAMAGARRLAWAA